MSKEVICGRKSFNTWVDTNVANGIPCEILGLFCNEFGETFLVYKLFEDTYVTGDEFEWTIGWKLSSYNTDKVTREFLFSSSEQSQIKSLLKGSVE